MNKKVLLLNPYIKTFSTPFKTENLSLSYLSAYLNDKGINTLVYDADLYEISIDKLIKNLDFKSYTLIGITLNSYVSESIVVELCNLIKQNYNVKICLGGHYASLFHKQLIEKYKSIDFVIRGDGEILLHQLVENLDNLYWQKSNDFISSKNNIACKIYNIENLDELPWPDRNTLNYLKDNYYAYDSDFPIRILSSRGCYAKCTFCDISSFYKKWRYRNSKDLVDEIEYLMKKYNSNFFRFTDDEFIGSFPDGHNRIRELMEEILNRELNIKFSFNSRVQDVNYELFNLLKKAGCVECYIGLESANDRILKLYKKGHTLKEAVHAIKILRDLNINFVCEFIMFDPRLKYDELKANFEFITKFDLTSIASLTRWLLPYYGTSVYKELDDSNLLFNKNNGYAEYKCEDQDVDEVLNIFKLIKEKYDSLEKLIYKNELEKELRDSIEEYYLNFLINIYKLLFDQKAFNLNNEMKNFEKNLELLFLDKKEKIPYLLF